MKQEKTLFGEWMKMHRDPCYIPYYEPKRHLTFRGWLFVIAAVFAAVGSIYFVFGP